MIGTSGRLTGPLGCGSQRRGAALAVALFALVTIGAIAQAVLQPAIANRRASRRLASQHLAESAAERAVGDVVATRPRRFWRGLTPGVPFHLAIPVDGASSNPEPGDARGSVQVTRLDSSVYSVVVEASVAAFDLPATVRRSLLLEWRTDSAVAPAAIVAGGDVSLAGDTHLGRAEDCSTGDDSTAAVMVGPDATVRRAGAVTEEGVRRDVIATAATTYERPGGIALGTIVAEPDIRLPPGSTIAPAPMVEGDRCIESPSNWGALAAGELAHACAGHAPVVVADGDLRLEGGEGRGTLVVRGHLSIAGSFRFSGLIVASGGITTSGGAMHVTGAVFVPPGAAVMLGADGTVILASRCALQAAADAAARLHIVPVRGWGR